MQTLDSLGASNQVVRRVLLPFCIAMSVIFVHAFAREPKAPELDEFYYLTIARDMALHSTFTDGTFKGGAFWRKEYPESFGDEDPKWASPGRFFAPGYPTVVFLAGLIDSRTAEAVRCHVGSVNSSKPVVCPKSFETLIAINVLLWSIAMLSIFQIAFHFVEKEASAWGAMLLALFCGETGGYYAATYLSENLIVPVFCLFLLFAVRAVDRRGPLDCVLTGVFLGAASLARPGYIYLFYALVPALAAVAIFPRRSPVLKTAHVLLFTAGALAILSPWLIRNYLIFGDFRVSTGYAELILIQRVAYNQMSWGEWLVSLVYWLPDFGDGLAKEMFSQDLWMRLGWSDISYYVDGSSGDFKKAILAANPQDETVLPYVIKTFILGDIAKHTAVTMALAVRGAGVGKYIAIAAWILVVPAYNLLRKRRKAPAFLVLLLLPLFMVGLHAFVSVSIARYNVPIIAAYSTIIAVAAETWISQLRERVGT